MHIITFICYSFSYLSFPGRWNIIFYSLLEMKNQFTHIHLAQRWALLIIQLCCHSLLCIQNVIVVNYKTESINAARYEYIYCVVAATQTSMQNSFSPNSMQWEMCVKFMQTSDVGQNGSSWSSVVGWLLVVARMADSMCANDFWSCLCKSLRFMHSASSKRIPLSTQNYKQY